LGSRSRKRGRPAGTAAPAGAPRQPVPTPGRTARDREAAPGPLDEFSAVAAPVTEIEAPDATPDTTSAPDAPAQAAARPKKLRGEAANEAVRAELKPLGPDERPPALLVAVAVTGLVGLANVVLFLAGVEVDGRAPSVSGVVGFAGLMFVMSWGMWRKRYWAILGFQALLALIVVVFALFLPTASNLEAVAVCVVIVGLGGWLFWKLVRVLSRVQMPERPGA
jgi:hypothetical protein